MSVRSKYLPVLSVRDRAKWAYNLGTNRISVSNGLKFTVTDADIAHAQSTRADVEEFIDDLAAGGDLIVLRSSAGAQSWVRIIDRPTSSF
jgi:hypothetical protein